MCYSRYKMSWRGIRSSSWSSTHSPPLQMLIIKYLLLATYFVTQVAVLAAPIPSDSEPTPPGDNALSARQMHPVDRPPTRRLTNYSRQRPKNSACTRCREKKLRCSTPPCAHCTKDGVAQQCATAPKNKNDANKNGGNGVSLSLWRSLFSIVTRGMT